MPCYNHKCNKCDHIQEEVYSIAECDTIVVKCNKCKGKTTRQMSTGVTGYVSCRTLGALADYNAETFSEDRKQDIDAKRMNPEANQLLKPKYRTKGT